MDIFQFVTYVLSKVKTELNMNLDLCYTDLTCNLYIIYIYLPNAT